MQAKANKAETVLPRRKKDCPDTAWRQSSRIKALTPGRAVTPKVDCKQEQMHARNHPDKSSSRTGACSDKALGQSCLWLWGANKEVAQPHSPKQAIRPGQVGICLHHKGVALHKGAQVHHGLQLFFCQAAHNALVVLLGAHFQRPLL